jgi:hypothetical protein
VSAKLKGRTLTVAVKAKGSAVPHGKKLVKVSVGKRIVKVSLNAKGKATVKLPKATKGTRITVRFLGTADVAPAVKVLKVR